MRESAPDRTEYLRSSEEDGWDARDDDMFTPVMEVQTTLFGVIGVAVVLIAGLLVLGMYIDAIEALPLSPYGGIVVSFVVGGGYWLLALFLLEEVVWTRQILTTSTDDDLLPENTVVLIKPSPTKRALQSVLFLAVTPLLASRTAQLLFSGRDQLGILVGIWVVMVPVLCYFVIRFRDRYRLREIRATKNVRAKMRTESTDS
jgi:hypothetical protein